MLPILNVLVMMDELFFDFIITFCVSVILLCFISFFAWFANKTRPFRLRLYRSLLKISQPEVTKQDAIDIPAKEFDEESNFIVSEGLKTWLVSLNSFPTIDLVIDNQTGSIIRE